ncbi:MAG: hypothetical protein ABI634_17870 [Acidobacteriota bacterium]
MTRVPFLLVLSLAATVGCARKGDIDKVPVGSEVQVTRQDGGLVEGKLTEKNADAVKVDTGDFLRTVPVDKIADVRLTSASVPEVPPRATFREVHVPSGTALSVRLLSSLSSESSHVEDSVEGELTRPVLVDGVEVIPAGSTVRGVVTQATPSGRVKGKASLGLRFTTLEADHRNYPLDADVSRTAPATKRDDAAKIGIPAAGGAIIGAIIGGKQGAAIGAAAGGGGGTVVVLSTPGKPVTLARGHVLSVQLDQPVDVRVDLK